MLGLSSWLNEFSWGKPTFFVGLAMLAAILFKWFGDVIRESLRGYYNKQVDTSFRMRDDKNADRSERSARLLLFFALCAAVTWALASAPA